MLLINVLSIIKYDKVDITITYYFFGLKLYLTSPLTSALTSNRQIDPINQFPRSKLSYKDVSHIILSLPVENCIPSGVYCGHLGFMQIARVPQGCRSGNQAKKTYIDPYDY